jgi:uncharacterized membrane protein
MLIPFPIALWTFSCICDLIYVLRFGGMLWKDMAFFSMAGGVIGALMAAVPGYLDYRSLVGPTVRRLGRWHLATNLFIVVLFAVNLWLRLDGQVGDILPFGLSLIGLAMLGISGWLGGELVYVHGVAVEPQVPVATGTKGRGHAA